jgi:hypothetical protein
LKKQLESLDFKENEKNNSVYAKFKNENFIFHILYIDDILLTSSDVYLSLEKKFLSSSFNMNNLGEVSFVLGIGSHRDRKKGIRTIAKTYLEKVLKK